MKRILGALALFLALTGTVHAAPGGCTNAASLQPTGQDEAITVSSTAVGFTAAKIAGAIMAVCTVETDSVRFRVSGLAPTAAVGHLMIVTATAPGQTFGCGQLSLQLVRFIRVTTDAALFCTYYREAN